MKVKVLFGISAMLLTTQITMAQIKDVVKNDTTTLNKKESKEWYEKEHGAVSKQTQPHYFVNGMDSIIIPNNVSRQNSKSTVIYRTL